MNKPKLYISGAISGIPDLNVLLFAKVTKALRDLGYIVVNPHVICQGIPAAEWSTCMRKCIIALMDCDIIIMLDDWQQSKGATIEYEIAQYLQMPAFSFHAFLQSLTS